MNIWIANIEGIDGCGLASSFGFTLHPAFGYLLIHSSQILTSDWKPFGRHFIDTEILHFFRGWPTDRYFDAQDLRSEGGLMPIHDVSIVAGEEDIAAAHKTPPPLCSLSLFFAWISVLLARRAVLEPCFCPSLLLPGPFLVGWRS